MNAPRFAGVDLTPETIAATREHFAQLARDCIAEAESGAVRVNDLQSYVAWQREMEADSLAGKSDNSFTFLQLAHWIQTGDCVPLLAPSVAAESLKEGVGR